MGPPYLDRTNNPFLYSLIPRRNVFVSYFHGDQGWAQTFVDAFGKGLNKVFTPKALGLSYDDDEIQSSDPNYVMGQIRERKIVDSTVQIVLIGPCTHSRRYIDWEIKRCSSNGNGLVGILIPPHISAHLPERFQENYCSDGQCYARFYFYPQSRELLTSWIEDAYEARSSRRQLVRNVREAWGYNKTCSVCGYTHN